jgi:hypothetical protein
MHEMATIPSFPPSTRAEMREARAAAKRLGVDVVQRGPGGQWRAARLTPTERRRHRLAALLKELDADRRLQDAKAMVARADDPRRRKLDALVAELHPDRRARLACAEAEIGGWR